jgi:putative membrane protein
MLSQTTYPDNNQGTQDGIKAIQKAPELIASVNTSDKLFARNAAQIGMAEVELADLAQRKSSNGAIRDFAKKMVADHEKANEHLRAIVRRQNIGWPADLNEAMKAEKSKLSRLSGAAFDKEYMKAMIYGHQTAIADFQREVSKGTEASLRDFASETLPSLREHLKLAQDTLAIRSSL